MSESARDWRGTPVEPGQTVIYGAGVGRSIAMVQGVVESFTKSGRVNVRVTRRAYGGGWYDAKPVVHVGADRLTVVTALPPTDLPTEQEKAGEHRAKLRATYEERLAAVKAGAPVNDRWDTVEYLEQRVQELS